MRKRLLVWLAAVLCLAAMPAAASACTLFAANGADWVQGGGSLIVKNRDWTPEYQELRLVRNRTYAYYGIFGGEAEHLQLKGGVNAKGLAVFTASASAIPRAQRQLEHGPSQGTLSTLLGECASVGEALAHTELFIGPKFLLLADAQETAYVEIAPGGRYAVRREKNGPLWHTNHYLEPELTDANVRIGTSSQTRYDRIGSLLMSGARPYALADFVAFSADQDAGPNNSIWRVGSRAGGEQTLATMAIYLPPAGAPEIYVKVRYAPEDAGQEDVFTLDGAALFAEGPAAGSN